MAKLSKQIIDQSAHFLIALAILLPLVFWPGVLTFALAGFALGMIREVTEDGPITSKGSLLDLAFWTLGGLVAGIVAAV